MKRSIASLIIITAIAAATGCSSSSGTSTSTSNNINLTELLNNASNVVGQLADAYVQVKPQIEQIEQLLAAWPSQHTSTTTNGAASTNCDACSEKSVRVFPAKRTAAVVCGLTRVDPQSPDYNGWSGECPGADVDAQAFGIMCQSEGVPYEVLLNERATFTNILATTARAVETLGAGDLLILFVSSHGGEFKDPADANEATGKSQTICLYDGQLSDNRFAVYLKKLYSKGVDVWFISDCCNAGTNYRGYVPHDYAAGIRRASAKRSYGEGFPNLLHWGGCADGKSSMGSAQGGTFTTAMVDSYKQGQSYDDFQKKTSRRMPWTQRAVFNHVGADRGPLPSFR